MRLLVIAVAGSLLTAPALAAPAKTPSKMGQCAAKWSGMSAGEKGRYKDRAKGMKSAKGAKLSGYNVWTGECMKKG